MTFSVTIKSPVVHCVALHARAICGGNPVNATRLLASTVDDVAVNKRICWSLRNKRAIQGDEVRRSYWSGVHTAIERAMAARLTMRQARKRACGLLMLAMLLVSSIAQNDTVRVKVLFEGISQEEFDTKFNTATLLTVATSAGVPPEYVYRADGPSSSSSSSSSGNSSNPSLLVGSTIMPSSEQAEPSATEMIGSSSKDIVATEPVASGPAPLLVEASSSQVVEQTAVPTTTSTSSTAGRRLSQVRAVAVYGIKADGTAGDWARPEVIRRKVLSSAAGFGQSSSQGNGKGFYATLANNGVKAEPMVYLDDVQILAGGLTTDAPKSRFGARTTADIQVLDHAEVKAALGPSAGKAQAQHMNLPNAPKPQ
ncbi:hypothetical protein COO60DRAFT_1625052 [Scenedesmus sp. NREL 46B-D3]|nr:hypothetical protein COO60DRAFT_1625052 [Scenedesmus sp. NREL 46B-D3]